MKAGYTQPVDQLPGSRTYVKDPAPSTPTDEGHEKERVLPSPPWVRSKPLPNGGTPQFGKPPGSDEALDGKPLSTERVRTRGKPGEDSPPNDVPSYGTVKRRPGLSAAVKGPRYPGTQRQHEQGGEAKRYYERYYRKNRNRIINRSKRWITKWKNQTAYKKDKARREESPRSFKRAPVKFRDLADRSKAWRENQGQKKAGGMDPISVQYLPTGKDAYIVGLDDHYVMLCFDNAPCTEPQSFPLEVLFNHLGFYQESDIDLVYGRLDRIFGYTLESRVADRYADFMYEKRGPEREPGQNFDRASPLHHMWPEHDPTPGLDTGQVTNNPGSAKVIPEGHGFENKEDRYLKESSVRKAMRISEIQERTGPKVHEPSRQVRVKLTRVDTVNHMWLFDVPGSQGTYKVRVKASPKGNVTDVNKMDVHVACTCPFWRWQGPEHWAKQSDYLYGKPAGTASRPVIKDPDSEHWACKHVLACLDRVSTFKMSGGGSRKVASLRLLANMMDHCGVSPDYPMPVRVAARYLEGREV